MPDEYLKHEWLQTNGLGGFACSTIAGANTRRYHGLLTAATAPPAVRYLLLSKLEETLVVKGERYELSTNYYPGVIHPAGFRFLTAYKLDPFPVFIFEAGGVRVQKRVFLVQGENTAVVEYEVDAPECRLEIRPLIAFRGYHDLTHRNAVLNARLEKTAGSIAVQPYAALPRVVFAHNATVLSDKGQWYLNFEYPVERERGLDFQEDLFCPFALQYDVAPGKRAVVIASTTSHRAEDAAALRSAETARRRYTGDQFIARRDEFHTIIAGYPWFTDWSRDAMVSLPGLTLVTGRFDVARSILLEFSKHIDQGMLPNRFPDFGAAPEYNTADATLWFFEAIRQYLEYTGDRKFVLKELYDKLKDIIAWHVKGTRFGIRMDEDGLLLAGDETTQLTWMDAKVGRYPVTPRNGKPVEIQALWYNALRFTATLAGDTSYERLADRVRDSFNGAFWNARAGCLYDVTGGPGRDASLRPNQVIALSLGYCAVPEDRARKILETVERYLLTPVGLRTLAPFDPHYQGRYAGTPAERDAAYHQGTVWPWLLGPFLTADVRFNGEKARARAAKIVASFEEGLKSGMIPEIYDGEAPHEPRGCFAQAWSVAELGRVAAELTRSAARKP